MIDKHDKTVVGFDTETYPIKEARLIPPIVCATMSSGGSYDLTAIADHGLDELLDNLVNDLSLTLVMHNLGFDLAVLYKHNPKWITAIFDGFENGRWHDTIIREKLLLLADTGDLEFYHMPGGQKRPIEYKLGSLVKHYFGHDISASKEDEDSWRMHFEQLAPYPSAQWPEEARAYAVNDAIFVEQLWHLQETRRHDFYARTGIDPLETQDFQAAVSFALMLQSAHGFLLDQNERRRIEDMLNQELTPEKMDLLLKHGILRPGTPPEPYANGAKDHVAGCTDKKNCDCPVKMKSGSKESINKKMLEEYVTEWSKRDPNVELKMTDKGNVSVDAEWRTDYAALDPVIEQLDHREKLQKLVTTYLPAMNRKDGTPAVLVHPSFNPLVSTGRTSSYASKIVPSLNIQNIDPRVRGCFVPRAGYVLFSIDYGGAELCTLAQTCLDLFGFSKLAELINAGQDAHEFLGAQIAYHTDKSFQQVCAQNGCQTPDEVFAAFHHCKSQEGPIKEFWAHYRKLAKPTGLGYPGGLGPKTFIAYAKTTFGVKVDFETASFLRDLWRTTFPEMPLYHKWVNDHCVDPHHAAEYPSDGGKPRKKYAYSSPMGMYRSNADFCAVANGKALQTPTGEGAKLAVFNVSRACYDPSLGSILLPDEHGHTLAPMAFVHDELLGEVREDSMMQARVEEVCRIMAESMQGVTPNVRVKCEPALMRRWNKKAEPVYVNGQLQVWEPDKH